MSRHESFLNSLKALQLSPSDKVEVESHWQKALEIAEIAGCFGCMVLRGTGQLEVDETVKAASKLGIALSKVPTGLVQVFKDACAFCKAHVGMVDCPSETKGPNAMAAAPDGPMHFRRIAVRSGDGSIKDVDYDPTDQCQASAITLPSRVCLNCTKSNAICMGPTSASAHPKPKRKQEVPDGPTVTPVAPCPIIRLPGKPAVVSHTPSPTTPTPTMLSPLIKPEGRTVPCVRSALAASPPRPSSSVTLPQCMSEDYDILDLQDTLDDILKCQAKAMQEQADLQVALWDLQHKFCIYGNEKGKKRE
ncbi:hypothetical protein SCLCIDRAFT_23416 [Scleroderma citrinum Foug A]|uniref:Uncharacterized protein n=1 Tax=Scleroderma citrinum Foug A TaxID=1036808 RepID=A0A0C2ZS68_9AGAM|nr:hypothetical protein SCLCIDRAFT_23416 [Scleroderma citrinum Foug A]